MRLFFFGFATLLVASAPTTIAAALPLKEVSLALLEIDPKEVGSKARPERRRVIEAAMQMAVSDRSAEITKKGMLLKIEPHDIFQAQESAGIAVKKAISGTALAGIGLPTSYYSEHGGLALKGSKFVVVSPFATSTKLARYAPNLILLMPTNDLSARAFSEFLNQQLKPKSTLAIVPWDNAYSKDFFEEFKAVQKQNVELVKVIDDQEDLDGVTKHVGEMKPDAIVLPTFPAFTGKVIRALHESGFRGAYAGPSSWGEGDGKPLQMLTKDLPIKAFTVREISEHFTTKDQKEFISRFNKESGQTYSSEAGLYYDAANLLIDRILEIGPRVDRDSLFAALANRPHRCGIFSNTCERQKENRKFENFKLIFITNGIFTPLREIKIEN